MPSVHRRVAAIRRRADTAVMPALSDPHEREVFLTRQGDTFLLTEGALDIRKSSYNWMPTYAEKIDILAKAAGRTSFIWGVPPERRFQKYESGRLVEREVQVLPRRIIGFVDVDRWADFLYGNGAPFPATCFSKTRTVYGKHDVLLPFPLCVSEVFLRRVYKRLGSPERAEISSQEILLQGARTWLDPRDVSMGPTTAEVRAARDRRKSQRN